jgi:YHS domain-containing protein
MTDIASLIGRIDEELKAEVEKQKAAWAAVTQANRERGPRLRRFDDIAQHLMDLLKPRLAAFLDRFKPVAQVQPEVREHTRAVLLTFASTLAKVALRFEVLPDEDVRQIRLEYILEIVPVVIRYDKHSVLEFPLDAVRDDAVIQWFDERILTFVRTYLDLVHQDTALQEKLKEHFVEDPITKIRFPRYLASSSLQSHGETYYFLDEETRREFEKYALAK